MNTEEVFEYEADSTVDAFYSYLLKESNGEMLCPEIKKYFPNYAKAGDIASILDGIEERHFPDHSYFRSEKYGCEIYQTIPVGEVEVLASDIDEESIDDFVISGEYAYIPLLAVTIIYNIDKLQESIANYYGCF